MLRALVWVYFEDLANLVPGVQCSIIVLERYGKVSLPGFIRPGDDGLALAVEFDGWLNDFIFKQVGGALLLQELHLVLFMAFGLNAEVASPEVLPPAVGI